jgi:hypothetical protein
MALYEIVLCYPDREEVRFTDRPVAVGDTVEINHEEWDVLFERDPADMLATTRFLLRLAREQRDRVSVMRERDRAMRERVRSHRGSSR